MDVVVVLDDLGADETFLEVGVDDACALRCLPPAAESPCFYFHFAGGDERLQVQQGIDGLDEAVASALRQTHVFEEHLLLLVGLQFGNVGLRLCRNDEHLGLLVLDGFLDGVGVLVAVLGTLVIDVANVEHGLRGQQEQVLGCRLFVLRLEDDRPGTLALQQGGLVCLQHGEFYLCLLVAAHAGLLLHLLHSAFHGLKVFQLQFHVNDFLVADGIHASIDMHDVGVVETTQNVNDSVALADVSQELVAQALAFRGTLHESGNIDNIAHGRHDATGMDEFGQLREPFVGHTHLPHLGINSTKRKIRSLGLCARQAIKEGGLADVGESHDTSFK